MLTGACCGYPGSLGWSLWQQYPASAALPAGISDLRLRTDASSQRTAERLEARLLTARPLADEAFAGVYTDGHGKLVTIAGVTGFQLRPDGELDAEFDRLAGEHPIRQVQEQDAGDRGGHLRCGTARPDGATVVICGWADHGSVATAVFTRRSVEDSADLLRRLRDRIITVG